MYLCFLNVVCIRSHTVVWHSLPTVIIVIQHIITYMCQFMTLFGLWNAIHLVINTLCLNRSDAKFHTTFILTRLTVFDCDFIHIYYYLILLFNRHKCHKFPQNLQHILLDKKVKQSHIQLMSIGLVADPSVLVVSPQVTQSYTQQ